MLFRVNESKFKPVPWDKLGMSMYSDGKGDTDSFEFYCGTFDSASLSKLPMEIKWHVIERIREIAFDQWEDESDEYDGPSYVDNDSYLSTSILVHSLDNPEAFMEFPLEIRYSYVYDAMGSDDDLSVSVEFVLGDYEPIKNTLAEEPGFEDADNHDFIVRVFNRLNKILPKLDFKYSD